MARIDLAILSSGIVGITSDMIKTAKYSLPDSVLIFDIDSREIFKNRREFIQATDSKVLLSSDINEENEQKLWELPTSLYFWKIKELEARIKEWPKSKSEHKMKAYWLKIREYLTS